MDFILPRVLYWQFFVTPQLPQTSFHGQTIIVTGGNAGLGLEAVRHFVQMGAEKVIIACRSLAKGETAKADVEKSTGKHGVIDILQVDLSSYDSVKKFAAQVNKLDRLDALIENAGIQTGNWEIVEGDESTITVNVVSTFLMALMVLPKLRESATKFKITPRLCIVASEVHFMTDITKELKGSSLLDGLRDQKLAQMGFNRYAQSKLLEVLYCRALAPRMNTEEKPFVTLNYINPGLCYSNLASEISENISTKIFMSILARKTDVGARTEVAAAALGKESHGKFINNGVISEPSRFVRSHDGAIAGERLYNELNAKLEKIQSGVTRNI